MVLDIILYDYRSNYTWASLKIGPKFWVDLMKLILHMYLGNLTQHWNWKLNKGKDINAGIKSISHIFDTLEIIDEGYIH